MHAASTAHLRDRTGSRSHDMNAGASGSDPGDEPRRRWAGGGGIRRR